MRRVETHVRVMAEREQFDVSDRGLVWKHGSYLNAFTRVHATDERSNNEFFRNALGSVASSAAAGQSHTVVVCGPPRSGRSQTMYDVVGPGAVHLMAKSLLAIEGATVHFTAYHVRERNLFDGFTNQPIGHADMPAPVGPLPLSSIRPLTSASEAVVVPAEKKTTSSCFVTFHVYKPLPGPAGQRRDSFAMVTMVDVCSFDQPMYSDVSHLCDVVAKENAKQAATYSRCKLTQLLEPSFRGGRALTVVCAVTGSSAMAQGATQALNFTAQAGKLDVVVSLCQLMPPSWTADVVRDTENLLAARDQRTKQAYACGIAAAYDRTTAFLDQRQKAQRSRVADDAGAIQKLRAELKDSLAQRLHALHGDHGSAAEQRESVAEEHREAKQEYAALERQLAELQHRAERRAQDVAQAEREKARVEAQLRDALADIDHTLQRDAAQRREANQHETGYVEAMEDADRHIDGLAAKVRRAAFVMHRDNALSKLAHKRHRVEGQLHDAMTQAKEVAELAREEHQRRSVVARVTHAEAKVVAKTASLAGLQQRESMRQASKSTSRRPPPKTTTLSKEEMAIL